MGVGPLGTFHLDSKSKKWAHWIGNDPCYPLGTLLDFFGPNIYCDIVFSGGDSDLGIQGWLILGARNRKDIRNKLTAFCMCTKYTLKHRESTAISVLYSVFGVRRRFPHLSTTNWRKMK